MHLRYETGVATMVQFVMGILLSFVTGGISIFVGCHGQGAGDCVSNTFVSLILIILIAVGYGVLLGVGYLAQERRSPRLALTLMALEALAVLIFAFDAKHAPDPVTLLANIISLALAAWVIFLAWRLVRAKGGRIVHARRPVGHRLRE
jgi:hypothetical protein